MKKVLCVLLFFTTIFTCIACGKKGSSAIESIYRTKEEWQARYNVAEYGENKEISEAEAEAIKNNFPELVAKCNTGTFFGLKDEDVLSWKGIPYAKAPTGKLRFMRSELPDNSDKYFEAYYFGKTAIQSEDLGEKASLYKQGEDCLNLNIWTNAKEENRKPEYKGKKKPVFVYIHGGGWGWGGTPDPLYDGWNFAHYNPDILLVTITYRVGMFGQINLDKVDNSYTTSMTNSVLDQVTALKWIYENIDAFGGDPENINIAGESAGGGSVSLLCTLPEARKYIKKAMPMSGGANQATLVENTYTLENKFIEDFNIKTREDIEKLTEEELMEWWHQNEESNLHHCVQDGVNIQKNPISAWENGDTKDLLVLQGHTANEFMYYFPQFMWNQEVFDKFCETGVSNLLSDGKETTKALWNEYKNALISYGYKENEVAHEYMNDKTLAFINTYQASVHARNGGKGYSYTFEKSYDGPVWSKIKAGHAIDCYYLFGNFDGNCAEGNNEEVELSRKYQEMLVNFCLTGDPSIDGYKWPEYNETTRYKMMFGDNLRVEENPEKERVEVEMKMAEYTDFFKPTTIAKIMEQLANKYPDMMINFVFENIEKHDNMETLEKVVDEIEDLYYLIISGILLLDEEDAKRYINMIVEYIDKNNGKEVEKAREVIEFFRKSGELPQ